MRAALAALAVLSIPHAALAQDDGVQQAARALTDVVEALPEDLSGAVAVRVFLELGDGAPDPHGLARVVDPMVAALDADERFDPVHRAAFGRDDTHPSVLARRLGYAVLVDVTLRRDRGALAIEVGVRRTPEETTCHAASARVPLDFALRRHVGFPAPLADDAVRGRAIRMPGREYVAVAVADLDADGRPELVAARTGEVHVFRLEGRRLRVVGRAPIPPETPRAASAPRRPVGSARADGRQVLLRISEHAVGLAVRLVAGVPRVAPVEGPCAADRFPFPGGCARLVAGRDFFDEELVPRRSPHDEAQAHFYAYAFDRYFARSGDAASFEALVTPTGRLSVRVRREVAGDGDEPEIVERTAGAVGYGTALAMGDLDLDGSAELLVSHAAPEGGGDQISLLRALPSGALRVMWRSEPVPGSVWITTMGDLDGDGVAEALAIEEPGPGRRRATLWIVR